MKDRRWGLAILAAVAVALIVLLLRYPTRCVTTLMPVPPGGPDPNTVECNALTGSYLGGRVGVEIGELRASLVRSAITSAAVAAVVTLLLTTALITVVGRRRAL